MGEGNKKMGRVALRLIGKTILPRECDSRRAHEMIFEVARRHELEKP
jgi:hypothetical protein